MGGYDYCKLGECLPNFVSKESLVSEYDPKKGTYELYPEHVNFSHDRTCNVACITCRDSIIVNNNEEVEKLDSLIEPFFLPMLKNAKTAGVNGIGEVFASKHSIKLVRKIIEAFPKMKFTIISNGILCNEKNCIDIYGDIEKIVHIDFSIHAATKETYQKIVKNGNFEKCMENLEWVSLIKRQGFIKSASMVFVIHSLNYHEMKLFLEKAISLDITAMFWCYWSWGTDMSKDFSKYSVWNSEHPEYKNFIDLLKHPIFDDDHCRMTDDLNNLRKLAKCIN